MTRQERRREARAAATQQEQTLTPERSLFLQLEMLAQVHDGIVAKSEGGEPHEDAVYRRVPGSSPIVGVGGQPMGKEAVEIVAMRIPWPMVASMVATYRELVAGEKGVDPEG